ncbi:MAG: hypothetical protein AB7U82_34830 [Blastocatellales bacterium]
MQREERGDWQHKRIQKLFVIKLIGYQEGRGYVWRVRCPCGHHRAIAQRNLANLARYSPCGKCGYKQEVQ